MTFDLRQATPVSTRYGWQPVFEAFSVCRHCHKSTTFVVAPRSIELATRLDPEKIPAWPHSINDAFDINGFINIKDLGALDPPDFVEGPIAGAFEEGAKCLAMACPNAAAAMFRLVIDLTTKPMLPAEDIEGGPNKKTRRDLGLRLPWLFDNHRLPGDLRELASCIREDGNDGAHAGTLTVEDAEDLCDFTVALLERIFTEPERIKRAKERRDARRAKGAAE